MNTDSHRPAARPDKKPPQRFYRTLGPALLALAACQIAAPAQAAGTNQFFFFPAAAYAWRSEDPAGAARKREGEIDLDLFYTADRGNLRFLAEVFGKTDGESEIEIERLQLSWKLDGDSRLWLGRFHNPIGFWNTDYHHGAFLQTSISRPGIVEFEDDGGVVPTHLTGALIEGFTVRRSAVWRYDLALGAGPELRSDLRPLEIHEPGEGSHDVALTARLSWQPGDSRNSVGAFAGYYKIPGADPTPTDVRQQLAGLTADWQFGARTTMRATAYVVDNELSTSGVATRDSFRNGNLQLEQALGAQWIAYGRIEGSRGADGDAYLNLLGGFVRERQLIGLRYDLAKNQAVKAEISKVHLSGERFDQINLQWSAVYP
ncbi:MAG: hypothetical protein FD165_1183 [Gammaproteobacteria bacterium]|nr:MAG: hypothetical protein FD165_1183 [Gammaproteobacteria bacterium]TND07342.1 MAG: hypothetical protein FD120_80 [Gammaproteobacteria bacterium]